MKKGIKLLRELSPNPNAIRIISNMIFKSGRGATFFENSKSGIELIDALVSIKGVKKVYLFDNFVTITKYNSAIWQKIVREAEEKIINILPFHDPDFEYSKEEDRSTFSPEIAVEVEKIEDILDRRVRPHLQRDGGDVEIISFDGQNLKIKYLGACTNCPSATLGTLKGIEEVLKSDYKRNIQIKIDRKDSFNIFY